MSDELDEVVTTTTSAGDHWSLALTGDWSTDISEALDEDHGGCQCEGGSCDICEAAQNGFPLSAAFLLQGATETPCISAVAHAYDRAGIDPPEGESLGQGWPKAEWDDWCAHHDEWGRKCPACGSYTFADLDWEPERCANCLAELTEHYAIAVVFHVTTNRGAAHAWQEFAEIVADNEGDLGAQALFASNPAALEEDDWQDPDYEVIVRSRGRTLEPIPTED